MPRPKFVILFSILFLSLWVSVSHAQCSFSDRTVCRLGTLPQKAGPLYVVDGTFKNDILDIDPHSVSDITILHSGPASALFGWEGMNGAIIITLKKEEPAYKKLDTVIISSTSCWKRVNACHSLSKPINKTITLKKESLEKSSTIKLYPNPVNRSGTITLKFPTLQNGDHLLKVTNVAGSVLLQKRFHAAAKEQQQAITCDSRWGGGIYYVWVLDETNKLIAKDSFIVQ